MRLKLKYHEADLRNFPLVGPLQERELVVERPKQIDVSYDTVRVRDEHGNTDELFPFWELIEITQ